jgi:hypothetical protein
MAVQQARLRRELLHRRRRLDGVRTRRSAMARTRYAEVMVSAARLMFGCLLWSVCIGVYLPVGSGMVMGSIWFLANPAAEILGLPGPHWSFVIERLASIAVGIVCGVGLGWLTARIARRIRLDWPHRAAASLAVSGVFVGVTFALIGWSFVEAIFMLAVLGPVLIGQLVEARFSPRGAAPASAEIGRGGSHIDESHAE